MNMKESQSGFTLMEMTIVIALLSFMMMIIIPNIRSNMDTAAAVEAKKDAESVMNISKVYFISLSDASIYDESYLDKKIKTIVDGSDGGSKKYIKSSTLTGNSYRYDVRGTPPVMYIDMKIEKSGLIFQSTINPLEKKVKITCGGSSSRCARLKENGLVD